MVRELIRYEHSLHPHREQVPSIGLAGQKEEAKLRNRDSWSHGRGAAQQELCVGGDYFPAISLVGMGVVRINPQTPVLHPARFPGS